ncbi:N-acetyltransferase 16 [Desmophyllum pertusum]|uniref:N-acetyltransferase 16 n=1 Tax=Desmophyllum pertusum TaxID=174260 RepID=A0A9W9ZKG1_9CNID|nr:N-acetyltransferase 16 [Desmophyllum pertusum]
MATNWFYARLLPRTAQFCRLILLDTRTRSFHSCVKGERLVIRLANQGDSEQMLKLSERIQDEFDYLPYRFHKWLAEPNRITVVAEMERQLVGNMGFSIVDGGKSVVIEAGRVDARCRGRGLAGSIRNFGNEIIRQNFPNVVRTRYAAWVGALQALNKIQQTYNDKELHRYDFRTYQVAPEHVNLNHKLQNCSNLQPCTKKEFRDRILVNAEDRSVTEHCKDMLENIPGVKSINGDESNQKMVIFESGAL